MKNNKRRIINTTVIMEITKPAIAKALPFAIEFFVRLKPIEHKTMAPIEPNRPISNTYVKIDSAKPKIEKRSHSLISWYGL